MAVIRQTPSPSRGVELMRYFASLLFGIVVIAVGVKIAVDHWPCEFISKWACAREHAMAQGIQQQVMHPLAASTEPTPYRSTMASGAHQMLAAESIRP